MLSRPGFGNSANVDPAGVLRLSGFAALTAGLFLAVRSGLSFALLSSGSAPDLGALEWGGFLVGFLMYLAVLGMFGGLYIYSLSRTSSRVLGLAGHAGAALGMMLVPVVVVAAIARVVREPTVGIGSLEMGLNVLLIHGVPLALVLISLYALGSLSKVWRTLPFVVAVSLSPVSAFLLIGLVEASDLVLAVPPIFGALASIALGYAVLSGRAQSAGGRSVQ